MDNKRVRLENILDILYDNINHGPLGESLREFYKNKEIDAKFVDDEIRLVIGSKVFIINIKAEHG